MHKILLIEDDIDYATVIQQYLETCGFNITWLNSPEEAIKSINSNNYSLIILDIMLPIQDGFSLSKEIQKHHPTLPFLFLTAKNQNIDRLLGLKLGAEDYISKSCDPEELKLRIDNILKHSHTISQTIYQLRSYKFYPVQLKLVHSKETFRLTERERDLLLLLIQYDKKIIKREIILKALWQDNDYFSGRSMDVFITRLRKYFKHDYTIQIISIRAIGFEIDLSIQEN